MSCEDGRLVYFAKGGSKDQLIPFGKDRFYFENNLTVMEFLRKDDGSISAMVAKTEERPDTFTRTDIRFDLPQAIHISREVLEKYVGDYKFPNNFILSIIKTAINYMVKEPVPARSGRRSCHMIHAGFSQGTWMHNSSSMWTSMALLPD
jgi:hypothetical protein